ncbi:MAG: hypothetical protein ACUVWY_13835 [Desulfosoma sp.]|uniref:hypothetical protein n=1 Tax=Desulfosoma sp. TaxID=2603217 RepID=UPI00404AEC0B
MKRCAALLIAVAVLAAVPVMAQDPGHVKIAPNNKGDLLIFPFYYTDKTGIWTKLTVVNTSEDKSTVAKVVIKSWQSSQETLDFLIYLSPADVWTGWLATLDDGNVYLISYDDSMLTAKGQWASMDNLVVQPLVVPKEPDGNWLGYVYVINAATDVDMDPDNTTDKQYLGRSPGVLKKDIKAWYDMFNDANPKDLVAKDGDGKTVDNATPLNILAGWMELTYGQLYNIAGLNATTLADYQNQVYIPSGVSTPLDQGDSRNTLADIEAALAKNAVAMPYVNGPFDLKEFTVHMFSFPTKGLYDGVPSPYFHQVYDAIKNPLACIKVERKIFDLSENSTTRVFSPSPAPDKFCYEVQPIVTFDFPFVEGWARYSFNDPASTTVHNDTIWADNDSITLIYKGAPVIPTLFDITLGGVFTSLRYGAWTDGEVTLSIGGSPIYQFRNLNDVNYHYSNIPVPPEGP